MNNNYYELDDKGKIVFNCDECQEALELFYSEDEGEDDQNTWVQCSCGMVYMFEIAAIKLYSKVQEGKPKTEEELSKSRAEVEAWLKERELYKKAEDEKAKAWQEHWEKEKSLNITKIANRLFTKRLNLLYSNDEDC